MGKYGVWEGIPRENVPWYPKIDADKCKGCKKCIEFCKHNVYSWDEKDKKVKVNEPYFCVVGCSNCSGLCKEKTIEFPPLTILKKILK